MKLKGCLTALIFDMRLRQGITEDYVCVCCGRIVSIHEQEISNWTDELGRSLCYDCAMWDDAVRKMPAHHHIVDRQLIYFPPTREENSKTQYLLTMQGEVHASNDFFIMGNVPALYRDRLPDTANFINWRLKRKIRGNRGFVCYKLGCWDRMNCMWFASDAQKDWNVIPKGHKEGAEKCPIYINLINPKQ